VCAICREPVRGPSPQALAFAGIAPEDVARLGFYRGKGCPSCNRVGLRGRQALFEVLTGAPEVISGIMNDLSLAEMEILARGSGMKMLRDRAIELVAQGITTFEEFQGLRL
jgi:type IV pilus assembly protein PilB